MESISPARFIDVHTHVQFSAYGEDRKEVTDRALAAGVFMINVGTQKDTSRLALEMAREYPEGVYAAVGLHPIHTEKSFHDEQELGTFSHSQECENVSGGFAGRGEIFDYEFYETLARDPKVVAIGECGLDYYQVSHLRRGFGGQAGVGYQVSGGGEIREKIQKQKDAFTAQIELSNKIKKPLILHCRDGKKSGTGRAFDDLVDVLVSAKPALPFVSHSFVRDIELAKKLLDLGSYFSFNGISTFTHDYDDVVRFLPQDRVLSETDAPYLAPVPHRGKRNEPAYVIEVVKKMAEIRGVSSEEMKEQIWANAKKVFLI